MNLERELTRLAVLLIACTGLASCGGGSSSDRNSAGHLDEIVYVCGRDSALCLLDTVDGTERTLASSVRADAPAWSPNAEEIVFASLGSRSYGDKVYVGGDDILVMNADGTDLRRLTSEASFDGDPTFSNDGKSILFVSDRDLVRTEENSSATGSLYTMRTDGTEIMRLTNNALDSEPAWSPDGSTIAFIRDAGLWVMHADGTAQRELRRSLRFPGAPAWSPDGLLLAIELDGAIYILNADGTGLRPLIARNEVADATSPTWSPDGKRIAFGGRDKAGDCEAIFVVDVSGEGVRRLSDCNGADSGGSTSPAWRPIADETQGG
jgi:TolB protein